MSLYNQISNNELLKKWFLYSHSELATTYDNDIYLMIFTLKSSGYSDNDIIKQSKAYYCKSGLCEYSHL